MQQFRFDSLVSTHGQSQCPLRFGQTSGTLNQFTPQCAELLKMPRRSTFFCRMALLGIGHHLHFAIEIVGQHSREDKYLVTGLTAGWDIVHLGLRLQFCKDTFLGTTAIVIGQQFSGMDTFVGDNHLEVVAVFIRNKQIQLDGLLVLFAVACADKDKALLDTPAFGLSARLKKIAVVIKRMPPSTFFNPTFEFAEALKGHADGKFHTFSIQHADDRIREESAIHPYLQDRAGHNGAKLADTGQNEVLGAVGVMDIAGAVPDIEHLSCLCQCAEQRIVGSLPLLFAVEAYRGSLGETSGGQNRAIEIQSDTSQVQGTQTLKHLLAIEASQPVHAPGVHPRQSTADGRHIR